MNTGKNKLKNDNCDKNRMIHFKKSDKRKERKKKNY